MTKNLPGRADIWSNGDTVIAALVQENHFAVARLVWDNDSDSFISGGEPLEWQADASEAETVTLERAPDSRFVVSYPDSGRIIAVVVEAENNLKLIEKLTICENTYPDDISLTTRLGESGPLCVIWSNQDRETLF